MHEFWDDDDGYTRWLEDHPAGFVLNVRRNPGASYAVLHRAACQTIARPRDDGAYTSRGYRKVVANSIDELRRYARSLGRADGSFSDACRHCDPLGSQAVPQGNGLSICLTDPEDNGIEPKEYGRFPGRFAP